jgi:hypothetical protein
VAVHAGNRPIGDRVGGIGQRLGDRDPYEPLRVDVLEGTPDRIGSGDLRNHQRAAGGDRRRQSGDRDRMAAQAARHLSVVPSYPLRFSFP